jgi:hypothetical protein
VGGVETGEGGGGAWRLRWPAPDLEDLALGIDSGSSSSSFWPASRVLSGGLWKPGETLGRVSITMAMALPFLKVSSRFATTVPSLSPPQDPRSKPLALARLRRRFGAAFLLGGVALGRVGFLGVF